MHQEASDETTSWTSQLEQKERKVDVSLALRAYQAVMDLGERDGDAHVYQGLRASTDFDGYTVILSDDTITLRILFHSRFSMEPNHGRAVDRFLTRLRKVAEGSGSA